MNPTHLIASGAHTTGVFKPRNSARVTIPDAIADQFKGLGYGPSLLLALHRKAYEYAAPVVDTSVVSFAERARRRAKGKAQRAARKLNRSAR